MSGAGLVAQSDGWGHMNGWDGGWMWLWGVAMMLLVVALVVWLIRSSAGSSSARSAPRDPTDRAREILAERFANGELSAEEYKERVDHLQ